MWMVIAFVILDTTELIEYVQLALPGQYIILSILNAKQYVH